MQSVLTEHLLDSNIKASASLGEHGKTLWCVGSWPRAQGLRARKAFMEESFQ